MKAIQYLTFLICSLLIQSSAQAIVTGELIMVRSEKNFSEAMSSLEQAIKKQGYVLSGIRSVDEQLSRRGFKTDKYRVIFFGKTEQNAKLSERYPDLVPYLPLKIVIFAEAGETLLVTADPAVFIDLYPYPELRDVFRQWHEDVVGIMSQVQN